MIKKFDDFSHMTAEELFEQDLVRSLLAGVQETLSMPYFKKGGKVGVLIIHGFTASPHEVLPLAEELEHRGFTVYAPRVAGHGVDIENLISTTYEDWYESLELGYNALKNCCDKIVVIGQSNGGLLATLITSHNNVSALGLLAPAFKVRIFGFSLIKYIKNIIKYFPRKLSDYEKKYNYNKFPSKPLYQMQLMQEYVQSILHTIKQPILLMVSKKDVLVSPTFAVESVEKSESKNIKYILDVDKYKHVIHIVTERKSAELIKQISDWVEGLENVKR